MNKQYKMDGFNYYPSHQRPIDKHPLSTLYGLLVLRSCQWSTDPQSPWPELSLAMISQNSILDFLPKKDIMAR